MSPALPSTGSGSGRANADYRNNATMITLMFLAIGVCAVLAVAGIVAVVLVDRAEQNR